MTVGMESLDNYKLKIHSLTKYGHDMLMKESFDEAGDLFLNAYQQSIHLDDQVILRGCCFNLGACYVAEGKTKIGLKYLEQAVPENEYDDGTENHADLWYNIGVAHHANGNIEEAIKAYGKSQKSYNELNWEKLEGECLSKLAVCYHMKNRLKESCEMFQKALVIFNKINDNNNYALCLISEISILSQMGNTDGCAKALNILLEVSKNLSDHNLQGKIYHDIGLIYISEKLYNSAGECFEQSLRCIELTNKFDKFLHATILQNIGAVYNYQQQYQKSLSFHQKSADLYGELNDRKSQAQIFSNLAYAYTQIEEYTNAVTAFQHAKQAAKDSSSNEAQILATEGLAAIWFRLANYGKTIDLYKEALSLCSHMKNDSYAHTNRLVEKLSDAMQHQLWIENEENIDNNDIKEISKKGKPRYSKDNRQSLIAKGLHEEREVLLNEKSSGNDSSDSKEEEKNEVSEKNITRNKVLPPPINGLNFNSKMVSSYVKNYDDEIPRADKEYYLARVAQKIAMENEETQEKIISSKTCLLM